MTTDRTDIPWGRGEGGATYRGFADAPPPLEAPRAALRRGPRRSAIAAGVLIAVGMGLGLGFLAKPNLRQPAATAPMRAVSPSTGVMGIEVNAPPPPAPIRSAGKLEVLPPSAADYAQRGLAPSYPALAQPAPMPLPVAPRLPSVITPALNQAPPVGGGEAACAAGRSRAAQMVCADPELAAADRELNQAYRRALRSGAPTEQLRDEQRDWLAIREDAARRSPRAVAEVYEQRIDELNQIADDGPG